MDLNDEMVEMMKFYEFYKKIKASEEKDKLTNKNNELFKKTEGANNKTEEVNLNSYERQEYVELRLNAPKAEKILLEFNPLKISDTPDWNPAWEEWHCYRNPLRIYQQDYEILVDYFNKIYPIKDAFDGTLEQEFSVCFDNWIGKNDWIKIIFEIEKDLNGVLDGERIFLTGFLEWLKEALKYSSIIVVEGNL